MTPPVIITIAITGAVPKKADNPAVPVTLEEQFESTHEAFEAGASLVHVHVRNPDQSSGSSPALFGRLKFKDTSWRLEEAVTRVASDLAASNHPVSLTWGSLTRPQMGEFEVTAGGAAARTSRHASRTWFLVISKP